MAIGNLTITDKTDINAINNHLNYFYNVIGNTDIFCIWGGVI